MSRIKHTYGVVFSETVSAGVLLQDTQKYYLKLVDDEFSEPRYNLPPKRFQESKKSGISPAFETTPARGPEDRKNDRYNKKP
jgi:hypothetical protein